jgi:hypothetical protein
MELILHTAQFSQIATVLVILFTTVRTDYYTCGHLRLKRFY